MPTSAVYEILNLKRRYGQGFMLDIPSLTIERKKSYGLVGPNGSGKSTLLRILAFIDEPDEGTIRFHGDDRSEDRDPGLDFGNSVLLSIKKHFS